MLPLRTTLLVNAISSGATGLLLCVFASPVAGIFGVTKAAPFLAVGLFLLVFALYVFITAKKQPLNPGAVRFITLLDTLWVLGSLVAAFLLTSVVSTIGIVVIVAVAGWVALMAWLQFRGLPLNDH